MKTILLCGSPKGNVPNSGSYLLAQAFVKKMENSCEIHSITKEENTVLYDLIATMDSIIFIIPNYIHSIPSPVLEFIYGLPQAREGQSIGFIIQSGYPESSESEIIARFLEQYSTKLEYHLLGVVIKGECAGLALMPDMFGKVLEQFTEFGTRFEQTGEFDQELVQKFESPIRLTSFQCHKFNLLRPINKFFLWGKMLRKHNAYGQRLDQPYLNK